MPKSASLLTLALVLLANAIWPAVAVAAPLPLANAAAFQPESNEFARAVIMLPRSHRVLYGFKAKSDFPAASLTKLVNALAFVHDKRAWSKVVALRKEDEVGGGRLRLAVGARLSLQDLLYSSITGSANNAAMALARLSGLGKKGFLRKMNQRARQLGANHSAFVDPSGIDPGNRTTAEDMALIASAAFRQPMIRAAASAKQYQFVVRNTRQQKTIHNTNHLLTQEHEVGVIGGKTGYLVESQYNLVVELSPLDSDGRPVKGKDVVVVVLGAPTKEGSFQTAKRMAEWAWQHARF